MGIEPDRYTAARSRLRQRHILTETGLLVRTEGVAEGFRPAEGVLLFEDPATTSKTPALERPAFARIAAAAHPGDVQTVSESFRLCRDLIDIHLVRDWCQARGVDVNVLPGSAPPNSALPRYARFRSAFRRSAIRRSALLRPASRRSAPAKFAPRGFAPARPAPRRPAPRRFAPAKNAPDRFA